MAAAPLAGGRLFGARTELGGLAARKGRTEAEVALRWALQRGFVVTPRSKDPKRIEANAPFGFWLTPRDMADVEALDRGFASSTSAAKAMQMPWEAAIEELSEVSDDGADEGKGGQRRRRRRKRKGKGKGKGQGKGAGAASGGGGAKAAQRRAGATC